MKVLVADKFESVGLEGLKALGLEVGYEPDLKEDSLKNAIKNSEANVLVVRSTKVTADMFEESHLGLIIRAGAGYNTIDVSAASNKGIYVANCPGKNSHAVAELAFGLILACDRRIPDNVAQLREGKWNKKEFSAARGLYGRTLGLVGMGQIGQNMVPIARAFGMNVIAYSRWMTADVSAALGIGRAESLNEIATQADIISVHVALTADTKGMLGKEFFDRLPDGAIFINTSRSEVVDQAALEEACNSGSIRAGLDVFEGEPSTAAGAYDGSLKNSPIYATHHIGASTEEAQNAVAEEVVRIVREYKTTGHAPNVVNVPSGDKSTHLLIIRHADRVGVLAALLGALKDDGVNVQEMENIVLGPSHAAIAQIAVAKEPSPTALRTMRTNPHVFDVQVIAIER
ncbi:MAG: hypothetical protein IT206_04570 [Fimbriimonadaceae bacterium]|nr:hypothetical protein [Fimbriimonadaceae bacterium]